MPDQNNQNKANTTFGTVQPSKSDTGSIQNTPPPPPVSSVPPPPAFQEVGGSILKEEKKASDPKEEKKEKEKSEESVSAGGGEKPKKGRRIIATILGVLLLVGGIGAGVILVRQQQDIREKAFGNTCSLQSENGCELVTTGSLCLKTDKPGSICKASGSTDNVGNPICKCSDGDSGSDDKDSGNACTSAGGVCLSTPSCSREGRTIVNGGNGCNTAGEICCSKESSESAPTPNACDRSAPDVAPGPDGKYCDDKKVGASCEKRDGRSGTCQPIGYAGGTQLECTCKAGAAPPPPPPPGPSGKCSADSDSACVGKDPRGSCGSNRECKKDSTKTGSDGKPICICRNIPRPTGAIGAQCLEIRIFDTGWNRLSADDLTQLKAGDVVRLTVAGTTTSGFINKARFIVNGQTRPEVTEKRPNTERFFDQYTIPESTTEFAINAQLHHTYSSVGWF